MRHWVGFVLFLLALGTVRMVGCGDEEVVHEPEYPRCLLDRHCDDGNLCTLDSCSRSSVDLDGYRRCEHQEKPCNSDWHEHCFIEWTRDCDPDTGVVECTWDTELSQGQYCCIEGPFMQCKPCAFGICCGQFCERSGWCIDGYCVDSNGYPSDCTDREDARPCEVGDTIGLCWKGDCAALDCSLMESGELCWVGGEQRGECRSAYCFYAEPSGGGPPGWTCGAEYYGTGDGCDCGCGVLDPDCADGTVDSCDYCALAGSCEIFGWCEHIEPAQNWLCREPVDDCGNGLAEGLELCDGPLGPPGLSAPTDLTDLADLTCADFGFTGGELACNATCDNLDLTGCTGGPAGWTCPAYDYGTGGGNPTCDCGCGVLDPDCLDGLLSACRRCRNWGSCSPYSMSFDCPGDTNRLQNWLCED